MHQGKEERTMAKNVIKAKSVNLPNGRTKISVSIQRFIRQFFYLVLISFASLFALEGCSSSKSVNKHSTATSEMQQSIANFTFKFNAQYAYPMGYKSIYLNYPYSVIVKPDTVQVYLPYFGRAYVAPMNPDESGFQFTSTRFEKNLEKGKKTGNWRMVIKTNDTNRQIELNFDLWENGSARLDVIDPNRQAISYQGTIEKLKPQEQKK